MGPGGPWPVLAWRSRGPGEVPGQHCPGKPGGASQVRIRVLAEFFLSTVRINFFSDTFFGLNSILDRINFCMIQYMFSDIEVYLVNGKIALRLVNPHQQYWIHPTYPTIVHQTPPLALVSAIHYYPSASPSCRPLALQ